MPLGIELAAAAVNVMSPAEIAAEGRLGRTELAAQLLRESLDLLSSQALCDWDTRRERAFALLQLGGLLSDSDRSTSRQLYERSLTLYRALNDPWGTACVLELLGWMSRNLGAYDEAKRLLDESLAIRQRLGDRRGIATTLWRSSVVTSRQGQLEESIRLAERCIEISQEIGDPVGAAEGRFELANRLVEAGEFVEAQSLLERVMVAYDHLGMRARVAWSHHILGLAQLNLGLYGQAQNQFQTALSLFRGVGSQHGIGIALGGPGLVSLGETAYAVALPLLEESVALLRELGQWRGGNLALVCLAIAARGLGQRPRAWQYLGTVLQMTRGMTEFWVALYALSGAALLLVDEGEAQRAVELYALASRFPCVANSRWWEDVAGVHIAAAAATLPPEVAAAAQGRGRARDLWDTVAELRDEWEGARSL